MKNIVSLCLLALTGFSYSQIKTKFSMGRFYCEGLSSYKIREVENKISELLKKKNNETSM